MNEILLSKAKEKWLHKTKPAFSLGYLEEVIARCCAIWESLDVPDVHVGAVLFAADHGVIEEGVSSYPKSVTLEMMKNFALGGACINVFARSTNADLFLVDVGIDGYTDGIKKVYIHKIRHGTANFLKGRALEKSDVRKALEVGDKYASILSDKHLNLGVGGDMGIGNTTSASAIISCILSQDPANTVGPGAGMDKAGQKRKIDVIRKALELHKPDPKDPEDILKKIGGLEITAMVGFYTGLKNRHIPIILDGLISKSAFLLARLIDPNLDHFVFFGHQGKEPGSRLIIERMKARPLLALDMALGEGTGAILAADLIRHAYRAFVQMATFEDANISSDKDHRPK